MPPNEIDGVASSLPAPKYIFGCTLAGNKKAEAEKLLRFHDIWL